MFLKYFFLSLTKIRQCLYIKQFFGEEFYKFYSIRIILFNLYRKNMFRKLLRSYIIIIQPYFITYIKSPNHLML